MKLGSHPYSHAHSKKQSIASSMGGASLKLSDHSGQERGITFRMAIQDKIFYSSWVRDLLTG